MDIFSLNLVNSKNKVDVKYTINPKHRKITCTLLPENQVLILGHADNNYIYWASITSCKDLEINEKIFEILCDIPYLTLTSEYKVFDRRTYYSCVFEPFEKGWRTEFGHYYGKEKKGYFFAVDINALPDFVQTKCEVRLAGNAYISVLEAYKEKFSSLTDTDAVYNYYQAKPIIELLNQETYLYNANNIQARELYVYLMKKSAKLYNDYMTVVR